MSVTALDQVLIRAVHSNNQYQLDAIIKSGFDVNSHFLDTTLLIEAICCGNKDLATKLLQNGASPDVGNEQFVTPLAAAAARNDLLMVQILLDSGCDIAKLNDGRLHYQIRTPLHYAISHGNITMVRLLIERGHCVNFPTLGDLLPMHDAIIFDSADMLNLIVNHPTFSCSVINEYWRAPLYQSLFINTRLHIAKTLLMSKKFGLYFEGHSLLEVMLEMAPGVEKVIDVTKLLLYAGCDVLHLPPGGSSVFSSWLNGDTILGGVEDRKDVMMLLSEAGLSPTIRDSNDIRKLCSTPAEHEFFRTVYDKSKQPKNLHEVCRSTIRACLGPYSNDKVDTLALPYLVKKYIKLGYALEMEFDT